MIISVSSFILPRQRRGLNYGLGRRRLLASLFLLALFLLGLSVQDAIRILTKTDLHSANWIWSEERKMNEYCEYDEAIIPNDSKPFKQKTLGKY